MFYPPKTLAERGNRIHLVGRANRGDPGGGAAAVARLLDDVSLRNSLATNSLPYVSQHFTWSWIGVQWEQTPREKITHHHQRK
jgi:hypothetical protein